MAKLAALSLQKLSPITFEYTINDISSKEEMLKVTKSFCIVHYFLVNASAHLFASRYTCFTLV